MSNVLKNLEEFGFIKYQSSILKLDSKDLAKKFNDLINNDLIKNLFEISVDNKTDQIIFRRYINRVVEPLSLSEASTSKFKCIISIKVAEWSLFSKECRFYVYEYNTRSVNPDTKIESIDNLIDYKKDCSSLYEFYSLIDLISNLFEECKRLNPEVDFKSIFDPLLSIPSSPKYNFSKDQAQYDKVFSKLIKKYNKISSDISNNEISIPKYTFGIMTDIYAINPSLLNCSPQGKIELKFGFIDSEYNVKTSIFNKDDDRGNKFFDSVNPTYHRKSVASKLYNNPKSSITITTRPDILQWFMPNELPLIVCDIKDYTNPNTKIKITQDTTISCNVCEDNWINEIINTLYTTLPYIKVLIDKDTNKQTKTFNIKLYKSIEQLIKDLTKWNK